jgi:hypothetical protein
MVAAPVGQAVETQKRSDATQTDRHSFSDLSYPSHDAEHTLREYGQDRAAMALNFISTQPDASAVRITPNSKLALGKDAHALADEKGAETGQAIAQEIRAAGGAGSEAAATAAGHSAREHFKNYVRGQITQEEKTPNPASNQNQDPNSESFAENIEHQLPEARGKKQSNLNVRAQGGLRFVGQYDQLAQPIPEALAVAQPTPTAQVDKARIEETRREFQDRWLAQQPVAQAKQYDLSNFQVKYGARLTVVQATERGNPNAA